MAAADQGPEPSAWELMRGLERVEQAVERMGGKFVSLELYTADRKRDDDRAVAQTGKIAKLESDAKDAAKAAADADARAEEQRTRNRQFLIGIIASPFVGAIVAFIVAGGLRP